MTEIRVELFITVLFVYIISNHKCHFFKAADGGEQITLNTPRQLFPLRNTFHSVSFSPIGAYTGDEDKKFSNFVLRQIDVRVKEQEIKVIFIMTSAHFHELDLIFSVNAY